MLAAFYIYQVVRGLVIVDDKIKTLEAELCGALFGVWDDGTLGFVDGDVGDVVGA